MIITKTPMRCSLFGGGTDYPAHVKRHGGVVVGFAIDKYCWITLRRLPPFFEHKHRIVYSKVELVNDVADIQHPAVRAVFSEVGGDAGFEMHHDADLPARAGLGSSSAFVVGLLNAMMALRGQIPPPLWLAQQAIRIEQQVIGENVGYQDQVWAAHGGLNKITFDPTGTYAVRPLAISPERRAELLGSIMLFFTGFSRIASEVAVEQVRNLDRNEVRLIDMGLLARCGAAYLENPDVPMRQIGELLHETWKQKRELAGNVATPSVDAIYEAGMRAGAAGGKLLGAGGGGFMLFIVEDKNRVAVARALGKLVRVQVGISDEGSRVVLCQPNGL